jgi:hypothetical protein
MGIVSRHAKASYEDGAKYVRKQKWGIEGAQERSYHYIQEAGHASIMATVHHHCREVSHSRTIGI